MTAAVVWPDTTNTPPPADHRHGQALWLLGRHRQLAELVERLPGVVGVDPDGPWFDQDELTGAVRLYDRLTTSDRDVADDRRLDQLAEAGEPFGQAARALSFMSGTERGRLRLLATVAGRGVLFGSWMLHGFDERGQELIADWARAMVTG